MILSELDRNYLDCLFFSLEGFLGGPLNDNWRLLEPIRFNKLPKIIISSRFWREIPLKKIIFEADLRNMSLQLPFFNDRLRCAFIKDCFPDTKPPFWLRRAVSCIVANSLILLLLFAKKIGGLR